MAHNFCGREVKKMYFFGYEHILVINVDRRGTHIPLPNYMGQKGFGLAACRKLTSYQLNKLNFEK